MAGPCLCGDPYCPRCGNPALAEIEAAAIWLSEQLEAERLTPEEYRLVGAIGLAAVKHARDEAARQVNEAKANDAEARAVNEANDAAIGEWPRKKLNMVEILEKIKQHHERYPGHGRDCACMDDYIRMLRKMTDAADLSLQLRIDHVLRSAVTNRAPKWLQ